MFRKKKYGWLRKWEKESTEVKELKKYAKTKEPPTQKALEQTRRFNCHKLELNDAKITHNSLIGC